MGNNINVKMWIDEESFTQKPVNEEIGKIRNREGREASYPYSLNEIEQAINGGHTFVLAELKSCGKSDKDFVSQQIFGVDIDNKDKVITVDEARKICSDNNLEPCMIYHTFSHTEEHPKFRMLFAFDAPEMNKDARDKINDYLIKLFNGDKACKDSSRLFFGGKNGCVIHKADVVNSLQRVKSYIDDYNISLKLSKEVRDLCKTVDFRKYIKDNCDGEWEGKYFNPCPFCQHNNDFTIDDDNNFTCYSESGLRSNGKHPYGNIISFMMEIQNLTREQAITKLYELCGLERPRVEKIDDIEFMDKETYLKNYNASSMVKDFWINVKTVEAVSIPTGFQELDKLLDGGLPAGLIFLGALSSLGKTTYVLQMADQIATDGQDVIIFTLEMSKYELIAKSVSRNTYKICNGDVQKAKTVFGITKHDRYKDYSEEERKLISKAFTLQHKISKNLYIVEGLGDVGVTNIIKTVKRHVELTGKKPVVIIDYLQILAPYCDRWTERQNIDKSVLELKRLSRDLKIPVIAISSFNRTNYSQHEAIMSAFKESGAIEYGSDILMALQFREISTGQTTTGKKKAVTEIDIEFEKSKSNDIRVPRKVELKILKNRNGKTGCLIAYDYFPAFNYFVEGSERKRFEDVIIPDELSEEEKKILDEQLLNIKVEAINTI